MKKLYTSATFKKMVGGRMHIPHPTPLNLPLAISYRSHQKSLAYFSYLAPLILLLCITRQSQIGGSMAQWSCKKNVFDLNHVRNVRLCKCPRATLCPPLAVKDGTLFNRKVCDYNTIFRQYVVDSSGLVVACPFQ